MNGAKSKNWSGLLRSTFLQAGVIAVISPFIVKAIEKIGGENLMKLLFQTFFIELWPVWVGIGLGLAYLAMREVISIHKFLTAGIKSNEKINELEADRRNIMTHVNDSYNRLSRRIDEIESGKLQPSKPLPETTG